jgi:phosphoglycolate phosphatase
MIDLMPPFPKAIIFDWDNTLVDTWPAITDALNKVRSLNGLDLWSVEEARVKSVRALRDSFPEWFGDKWEEMRDIFYEHIHAVHLDRLQPKEGAEALLSYLFQQNIPMFIVSTKKNVILIREVEHLGWTRYFKAIVGSLEIEKDKPHRMPVDFALATEGLVADNPEMWFVGDSHADVECALASGVTPVLVGSLENGQKLGVRLRFSDCHYLKMGLNKWNDYS